MKQTRNEDLNTSNVYNTIPLTLHNLMYFMQTACDRIVGLAQVIDIIVVTNPSANHNDMYRGFSRALSSYYGPNNGNYKQLVWLDYVIFAWLIILDATDYTAYYSEYRSPKWTSIFSGWKSHSLVLKWLHGIDLM